MNLNGIKVFWNHLLNSLFPIVLGGAGYKFLALTYNNKYRTKGIEMQFIEELRAEIKELRQRIDSCQAELDTCKRDFYALTEQYLGIQKD